MSKRPSKHFENATTQAKMREPDTSEKILRDKDNADKRITPPRFAPHGELNRAPRGMSGIKRDLPTPEHQKSKEPYSLTNPGDLSRAFQSIARGKDKDHGRDR
jgi:hypothetical protein